MNKKKKASFRLNPRIEMRNIINENDLKRVKCPKCKGWMTETKTKVHGFLVKSWKCGKCGETDIDILDGGRAQILHKLKQKPQIIGGQCREIYFDEEIKKMSVELVLWNSIPCIEIKDWTGKKNKKLIRFHITEAIELKSMIDCQIFDYLLGKIEGDIEK